MRPLKQTAWYAASWRAPGGLDHIAPTVAKRAVIDATALLKNEYPSLTTRVLDYVIWNYESRKSNPKPPKQPQDPCREATPDAGAS